MILQCEGKPSASYRRKLSSLVQNPHDRIGKDCASDAVHHHGTHSHLPFVRLRSRFTVNDGRHQFPVVFFKADLGDIPPGGLFRQIRDPDFLFQLGFQRGDIILEIDGEEVNSVAELRSKIASYKVGDKVTVTYDRNDTKRKTEATLEEMPQDSGQ